MREATTRAAGSLGAVVVHWRDEGGLRRLLEAWPDFKSFPLVVVDNSRELDAGTLPAGVHHVDPGTNLGFGGGVDRGVAALDRQQPCEWILIMNPDAAPRPGAVEALLEVCRRCRRADETTVGIAPALVDADGTTQHRWQLQPLPSPWTLLAQVFFLAGQRGPLAEPAEGAAVEQPAAAVLALHHTAGEEGGGEEGGRLFDPGYFPAWFEDVDLARRLADRGLRLRYTRQARFEHARGGSVPALGYGRFLWIYYRNLERYLRLHHGAGWAAAARILMPLSMLLRLLLIPLRRPRRARHRGDASRGLLAVVAGAVSGWRWPRGWAERFLAPGPEHE